MFYLSCHRDLEHLGRAARYRTNWAPFAAVDLTSVALTVTRFPWSPCQWFDGHRMSGKFGRANLFALDFDSGELSLDQAVNVFCDSVHIIGTTKSHQKDKGGIVCDRFRVILQLEEETDDARLFASTVKHYAAQWDADPKAVDAARFFWPCVEIVSVVDDGYTQEFVYSKPRSPSPPPHRYRESGAVRLRSQVALRRVWLAGVERNDMCFTVAKDLFDAGYLFAEIYAIILNSPTYKGTAEPNVRSDIEQCIRSAIKSVAAGKAYG